MKEKLQKRIIELIHGLAYEEAIKEERWEKLFSDSEHLRGVSEVLRRENYHHPFTLARIMQALNNKERRKSDSRTMKIFMIITDSLYWCRDIEGEKVFICNWKLTKGNGQECDLDDQSEETIFALWNLLKKD